MNIELVYKTIHDNNIKVFPCVLNGIKAVSVEADNKYGIFMNYNEIKDSDEEFIVVTHEYGHCMTGSTHPPYSPLDIIVRHEYRADRQSVLDFMPIDKLNEAMEYGCKTPYEFSDYLGVPEAFIIKAFEHYNAMNLI